MRIRKLSRKLRHAYAAVIVAAGLGGFLSGSGYAYLNPLAPLDDVWSGQYYFDTAQGEYRVDTLLNFSRRNINTSSVISDSNGKILMVRSAEMNFKYSRSYDHSNLYTIKTQYSKQFPNIQDQEFIDKMELFKFVRPKLYILDCNKIIVDMELAPHISYNGIFQRLTPINCKQNFSF